MSYKLYTDKHELFECKISLDGASLKEAVTRIIVNTPKLNLMFEGSINKDGSCRVPIKKLRGLLEAGDSGTIKLEVIADDTYFQPWESDFTVDSAKKIKVEVKGNDLPVIPNLKPQMKVSGIKSPKPKRKPKVNPIDGIVETLHNRGIGAKELSSSKRVFLPILVEYSKNIGYNKGTKNFIKEVVSRLSKKNRG